MPSDIDVLSNTDRALVGLLRSNARASVAELAHRLGVSRGTVTNRLNRLQDAGVIVGYTVRLRPDARPDDIRAWMGIAVEGNQTRQVITVRVINAAPKPATTASVSERRRDHWVGFSR